MSSSPTSAQCGVCGVIGLPAEMHRNSLPVPGTLPTTPNSVTYRCRDEAACVARLAYAHRNDALTTSDDPLYAAGNVIDRLRGDLVRIADDLAAVQDALGRFRAVHYQGEPDEATIQRVARAIAGPDYPGAGDDFCYREDAVRAIKAARFDAEEPVAAPEPCGGCHTTPDWTPEEAAKLRELADIIGPGFDPEAGLAMIRAAQAGEPDEMIP